MKFISNLENYIHQIVSMYPLPSRKNVVVRGPFNYFLLLVSQLSN
ncbi:hypothetical protein LV89_04390 [Arcicella aurantiaca]|uniref:Uncharacterized protein n=1 Tax=Arcicella aurantiaca TaxID=591202 RepID=A0A316DHV4_9BACT|nr:hypothetical protein LV89_04390 [Arcicella aurantiaca]